MSLRPLPAILAAAFLLGLPAPAPAAGVATNGRTLDLRFPSRAGDAACVSRPIELAFGVYEWKLGHRFAGRPTVGAVNHETPDPVPWRTYTWRDCIAHYGTGYRHSSYLEWREDDGTIKALAAPSYVFHHAASPTLIRTWFGSTLRRK